MVFKKIILQYVELLPWMFLQLFLLILPNNYAMMCAGNAGGKGKYLVSDVTATHTASQDSIMRGIIRVVELGPQGNSKVGMAATGAKSGSAQRNQWHNGSRAPKPLFPTIRTPFRNRLGTKCSNVSRGSKTSFCSYFANQSFQQKQGFKVVKQLAR